MLNYKDLISSSLAKLEEKHLTPAELKKREEIAKAMERKNPGMNMGKKMAIATAVAKRVAEETEQIDEALSYKQEHAKWGVVPKSKKEFVKFFPKDKEADAKAHAEKTGGTLKKIDQAGRTMKEEVEQIDEANHREFAAAGKMHPDMAKMMTKGKQTDFYSSKNGDKLSGIVTKNTGTAVHIQANKNGKVGGGELHRFSVSKNLGGQMHEETVAEEVELDEISTDLKQRYLDVATKKHQQQFLGRAPVRDKQELDKRRASIQKTSKELTGKTHYKESIESVAEEVELDETISTTPPAKVGFNDIVVRKHESGNHEVVRRGGAYVHLKKGELLSKSDMKDMSSNRAKFHLEEAELDEADYDWSKIDPFSRFKKPGEKKTGAIDWTDSTQKSKEGGTIYKAREKERNPEGGEVEKKKVGRPAGAYKGEYKKRDPAGKAASAAKAMASKAEGLKVRREFKDMMNAAIKKRQAELAGKSK